MLSFHTAYEEDSDKQHQYKPPTPGPRQLTELSHRRTALNRTCFIRGVSTRFSS